MAAVGPGGGVISKQPIKTSRRRYFHNGCRVEACGPLRRNHCIGHFLMIFNIWTLAFDKKSNNVNILLQFLSYYTFNIMFSHSYFTEDFFPQHAYYILHSKPFLSRSSSQTV